MASSLFLAPYAERSREGRAPARVCSIDQASKDIYGAGGEWSEAEIERRTGAQWSLATKEEHADAVLENSGAQSDTRRQVRHLWKTRCVRNDRPARRLA